VNRCPGHTEIVPLGTPTDCPLQRLADATITATRMHAPNVAVIVILVDLADGHTAMGASGLPAPIAARVLADEAAALRATAS
jgi:hypothetical protein